jgi:anti-sigma factor RsiW
VTPSPLPTLQGRDALAAHVEDCDACRSTPPATDRIASLLHAATVHVDVEALSQQVVERVRPELLRLARAAFWRQVALALAIALLPLPAVVAYDTYLLGVAYGVISAVLPAAFAAYLILTYAAFLALLFATTYAAIPVILDRGSPLRASATS